MLLKPQTKPTYLYQQYRSDEVMLSFFSLLDKYKTLNYNFNPQSPDTNNPQAIFYNLTPYSYYFLQCIYGFKYVFTVSDFAQEYYDVGYTYDDKANQYDTKITPLQERFFVKQLYTRKAKANRIFTIPDFIKLILVAINQKIQENNQTKPKQQETLKYKDIKITIENPRTQTNNTNQVLYIFTLNLQDIEMFNLLKSYLMFHMKHLPFCFNYRLIPTLRS